MEEGMASEGGIHVNCPHLAGCSVLAYLCDTYPVPMPSQTLWLIFLRPIQGEAVGGDSRGQHLFLKIIQIQPDSPKVHCDHQHFVT